VTSDAMYPAVNRPEVRSRVVVVARPIAKIGRRLTFGAE
jgi:hypothetical protein